MAYCRWSSMDYRCDLYAYEDVMGGVTLHVAGVRTVLGPEDLPPPVGAMPKPPASAEEWWLSWYDRDKEVNRLVDEAERKPIGLSRDGRNWHNLPHDEAAELVRSLRAEGYVIPEGVEDEIEEDGKERSDE